MINSNEDGIRIFAVGIDLADMLAWGGGTIWIQQEDKDGLDIYK